jgi:hypothetical protein
MTEKLDKNEKTVRMMFRVDHNTIIQVKESIYRIRMTQIQVSIISYGVLDIWPCEKMNIVRLDYPKSFLI